MEPAIFSDDRLYRYTLTREWIGGNGALMVIGLNPSTADAVQDDPTIRRCINYAKAWGYSQLYMLNLFAYRETDRLLMMKHPEPVGPVNDRFLREYAIMADKVVCAWGADGNHLGRADSVRAILHDIPLYCLKLTKDGHPGHPLYLKKDLEPMRFWLS